MKVRFTAEIIDDDGNVIGNITDILWIAIV